MYISESLLRNKSKSPSNVNISMEKKIQNRSAILKSGSKRKLDDGYSGTSKESKKIMFKDYNSMNTIENQTFTKLENVQNQEGDLSDSTLKANLTEKMTEKGYDTNLSDKILINNTFGIDNSNITSTATESNLIEKKMENLIKYSVINIPPICALCSESFESYIDVLKHKIKIHLSKGQNQFFCPICYEKFFCNNDLIEHLDEHTGVYSFVCLLCSGNYYNLETLR